MVSYNLYLDDIRDPYDGYLVARSYAEFKNIVTTKGCPSIVTFDHDLGEDFSGLDAAKFLVELDLEAEGTFIPSDFQYYVHSMNPVGRENIIGYLESYLSTKTKTS